MSLDSQAKRLETLLVPVTRGEVFRGFLHYFSMVLAVVLLFGYVLLENGYQDVLNQNWQQQSTQLKTLSTLISSDFEVIGSDIATLATSRSMQDYLDNPSPNNRSILGQRLVQFADYRRLYDQIRLINLAGDEVVRVNYGLDQSHLVPVKALQNKADRYYVQKSADLQRGQVYLSPLDLNVEFGEVQKPHKPMMRVTTPLYDANGERWGFLVLNYLAERFLGRIQELDQQTEAQLQLINTDGYWLYHADESRRWGFMFDRDDANYAGSNALEWDHVNSVDGGQDAEFEANTGRVYTWLKPTDWVNQSMNGPYAVKWLLLSEYPVADRLSTKYLAAEPKNLWVTGMLLLMLGVLSWFYSLRRLEKQRWYHITQLSFQCMEQNPAAVMVTDRNGEIAYTNEVFSDITGYTFEQVKGKKTSILQSGHTPYEVYRELWSAITRGKTWRGDIQNRKANGDLFWARMSVCPILNVRNEITHFLCVEEDVTDRVEFENKLHHIATHDALTDVENRRAIMQALNTEVERGMRYQHPLTVLMIDIDNFKVLNDTHGHLAGDAVLKEFAHRLVKQGRQSDRVGRFGGEEFLVVLPETGATEAQGVAQRLFEAISASPYIYETLSLDVTASFGCATLSSFSNMTEDVESLLKSADELLYKAKESGKNQIQFASEPP